MSAIHHTLTTNVDVGRTWRRIRWWWRHECKHVSTRSLGRKKLYRNGVEHERISFRKIYMDDQSCMSGLWYVYYLSPTGYKCEKPLVLRHVSMQPLTSTWNWSEASNTSPIYTPRAGGCRSIHHLAHHSLPPRGNRLSGRHSSTRLDRPFSTNIPRYTNPDPRKMKNFKVGSCYHCSPKMVPTLYLTGVATKKRLTDPVLSRHTFVAVNLHLYLYTDAW